LSGEALLYKMIQVFGRVKVRAIGRKIKNLNLDIVFL
jgi:hypothetical protein